MKSKTKGKTRRSVAAATGSQQRRKLAPVPPGQRRWILAAGFFAAAAAAWLLYAPIAEGFLQVFSDHTIHVSFAEQLYRTHWLPAPHFLYQALIALLVELRPEWPFKTAALIVLSVFYALSGVLLFRETARLLVPRECSKARLLRSAAVALVAAAAILTMQPVIRPGETQMYKIGYFWGEPYYSPTYSVMKPLALLSAFSAVTFLRRSRSRSGPIVGAALATTAGALAKPSFVICLAPAVLVLAGVRLVRRQPFDRRALLLGLLLPSFAVLGLEYCLSYGGSASGVSYQNSIIIAPFSVMRLHSQHLAAKFLLSVLFPVAVYVLYWRKARHDTSLNLAALLFAFGAGYTFLLAEKIGGAAGNFLWSGYITVFMLFVFAALFYVRQLLERPFERREILRHLAAFGLLLLHVRSGVLTEIAFLNAKLGPY
ncbi:MAG: hypothetical protein A2W03_06320 [Candidatus Aminicenantes bacterium RBG_16_63_16]|nr:MAG: hypothetical protein A2W03_06320 [Candidatus Aminicenantes bacterium RBG_16_63_16]